MVFHGLLRQAILIAFQQGRMQLDTVACNPGGKLVAVCTVHSVSHSHTPIPILVLQIMAGLLCSECHQM